MHRSLRFDPLPPRVVFLKRFARSAVIASGLIFSSLALGAFGYHVCEDLPWLDSTLNAVMILTGMGPVDPLTTTAGKLFGICYALFSGVAFLTMVAVLFAPVAHRFLHRFHLDIARDPEDARP
jgi:hypothetical protein